MLKKLELLGVERAKLAKRLEVTRSELAGAEAAVQRARNAWIQNDNNGTRDELETARKKLASVAEWQTALESKLVLTDSEIEKVTAEIDRANKTERLAAAIKELAETVTARGVLIQCDKFEGANRDWRLKAIRTENRALGAQLDDLRKEIENLAAELGSEISVDKILYDAPKPAEKDVENELLQFGVSAEVYWHELTIAKCQDRQTIII